ncbi:M3 family metallopeptidase [Aquabacterium sp. OR-4]|uniref:M3 family metallopeptidase n=1 Tax=Aquabacterium sp. OR-4 TaxID=2978127 RepID=UPI0021B280AC|nr:M3 family metallopeptidase [Aquabacterium sp. OR-4]MDT7835157.1 M3 family metallopeptidase [Aquabacterium sp. OR-4]
MTNPLLSPADLPAYTEFRPEHVSPALDELLRDAEAALERAVAADGPTDYDRLSALLDVPLERLSRAWGLVGHLNAVANTPELREAYNANLGRVTEFHTRLGADERLYARYKAIANGPGAASLSPARRQALAHALRDFVLSGAELQGEAKARFAAIQERLAELGQAFSEHVLDATDGFSLLVPTARLAGVPADVQQQTAEAAGEAGAGQHKLTLHMPVYLPVMQYADDRALRETLYRAYVTRASEFGPAERDNGPVMDELLRLRAEEAALLGQPDYASLSLVPKMAESPAQVRQFLQDLARRARPHAERDLAELRGFAAEQLGLADLQPWDLSYVSEKLKEARYAFSEQAVKQYFTEPKVMEGLFHIIETLFEVHIQPEPAPVWHEGVRFYRIERRNPAAGDSAPQLVGRFYLDPYARTGKRPGAWMDGERSRWARPDAAASAAASAPAVAPAGAGAGAAGAVQTPVAHLVCNFGAPMADKPATLSHDDVITLFHEFGHGLHHLLTQVDELSVAGISGVEWDAVELPSQFMENFCWEWEVISRLTAHADTGEPLPRALFDKMLAAKNFQSGLQTLRQIEFSLFDMRIHTEADAPGRVQAIMDEVRAEVAVLPPPPFNRFQHSFSHIFAGGYSAGYYSYKWAEVLSADAYAAFEEAGVFNPEVGRRFRREVLEAGGARPAMASFKAFRGREPSIDALLRHQGMA